MHRAVGAELARLAEWNGSGDHSVMAQVELDLRSGAAGGLLERGSELARLCDCVDAIEHGAAGRVVLLGGEAGVGKTALVEALAAARPEARIVRGECEPLFAPPALGPLLGIAEEVGGALKALVDDGAMPHQIAGALLSEVGAGGVTLFVLEDLHWADEATLDVFRLFARRIETVRCLLVATYRDEALAGADRLRIVLGELATARAVDRMRLPGLSEAAVVALCEPYGVDADELYRKTNGNPFFVVEALAAGSDAIPETVRDAVLARAARLGAEARALLDAVAVTPPVTELWLLRALTPEQEEHLDECLASGMLRSEPRGVAFRHDLARLAVEEEVAPLRREELHRRALAALADPPAGSLDLARVAHHAEAAGDAAAVLRYAPAAAARAASLGAHREAAAQYARALRYGDELSSGERAQLLESRSRECYLTDEIDEAIVTGEAGLELRRAAWGGRLEEGEALRWLSEILWCPGRTLEAERMARDSVALLETLPEGPALASAYTVLGNHCGKAGGQEEAIAWAGNGLALAHRSRRHEEGDPGAQGDRRPDARPGQPRADRGSTRVRAGERRSRGCGHPVHDAHRRRNERTPLRRGPSVPGRRNGLRRGAWARAVPLLHAVVPRTPAPRRRPMGRGGRGCRRRPAHSPRFDRAARVRAERTRPPAGAGAAIRGAGAPRRGLGSLGADRRAVPAGARSRRARRGRLARRRPRGDSRGDRRRARARDRAQRPVARRGARGLAVAGGPAADDAGRRRTRGAQRL